jgi:hypothetical protein
MTEAVTQIKEDGHMTIRAIMAELNRREIPSFRGKKWHYPSTYALLKRIKA